MMQAAKDHEMASLSIIADEQAETDEPTNQVNQRLAIATTALGLAVGGLSYPPLAVASIFPTLLLVVPILRQAHQEFRERDSINERVSMTTVDGVLILGTLWMGRFVAMSTDAFMRFLSQKIISQTEQQSKTSLLHVFGQQPRTVWIWKDSTEIEIPFETIEIGHTVIVTAGETVPVDGVIIEGMASIDQHMLTGESHPVERETGHQVMASTIVLAGRIYISVEKAGPDTVAAQIESILNQTIDFKSTVQLRAEELGNKYAYLSLAMSCLTWPLLGGASAISILHANFGYDLRVSGPLSILNFLRMASQHSILVKDGRALELLAKVDTIVFDKTGTLTLEVPHIGNLYPLNGLSEEQLITYAAAAETKQTHPIAQALLQEAAQRHLTIPPIDEATYKIGYGLEVQHMDQHICVGSQRFMQIKDVSIPPEIEALVATGYHAYVYVAINGVLAGVIELHSTIRPEATEVIRQLRQRNLSLMIISGDHEQPTARLAHQLGIDHYFAETLPEEKAKIIEQLQREGKSVCYIGDGINDSIALKQAHVSISLRGASTVATDTAQIILMDQSLNQLDQLFSLTHYLRSNMNRNIAIALAANVVLVGGVYLLHFNLVTAILIAYSGSFLGVINAMLPVLTTNGTGQKHDTRD